MVNSTSDREAYATVGQLVVEFARAETYVHLLAERILGHTHKGRIVFNGMRLGQLADRIRGMLKTDNVDAAEYADIDACLIQMDMISKVRHKLRTASSL